MSASVETPRKEHSAMTAQWQRCRDVIGGTDAVKAAGVLYLPKLSEQSTEEYEAYKMRATFYNGTARSRDALVGTLFREDVDVKGVPDDLDKQLEDVTLNDVALNSFALSVAQEVLTVGRVGVLIDMQGETVDAAKRRPYWVAYKAEQIINWQTVMRDGQRVLSLVILKEDVEEPVGPFHTECRPQYRVLQLLNAETPTPAYQVSIWKLVGEGEQAQWMQQLDQTVRPTRRGAPIPFIPFVICGPTSIAPEIEKPPLLDMIDTNLSLYRTSADLEHGRHFTALPTPWVSGVPDDGSPLKIGSMTAWVLAPQGQAGFLEFHGQGLSALVEAVKEKTEQMAMQGARMIESGPAGTQPETAEAVRAKHAATHATLKTISLTIAQALTKGLRWHAWWSVKSEDPADSKFSVTLTTEFVNAKLSPEEMKTLLLMVQAEKISYETFYYLLASGGWTRPEVDAEDELAQIESEKPEEPVGGNIDPITGLPFEKPVDPVAAAAAAAAGARIKPGTPPAPKPEEQAA